MELAALWERERGWLGFCLLAAAGAFIIAFAFQKLSPWPLTTTIRHIAAAPNCDSARAVGLAPARKGEPGYYLSHDRDRDGIACEPWPRSNGLRQ